MFERIKSIILEINDEVVLTENSNIIEDDLLDSMELVTFLVDIESEFGVEITADDFIKNELSKISDLMSYLEKEGK